VLGREVVQAWGAGVEVFGGHCGGGGGRGIEKEREEKESRCI